MPPIDSTPPRICNTCHMLCDPGSIYCNHCGAIFVDSMASETLKIAGQWVHPARLHWGAIYFDSKTKLFFKVGTAGTYIEVPISASPTVIGRKTGTSVPQVDLTPYGALELGVSRQHARIDLVRSTLQITDLYSANGTYLNRQRLQPRMPTALQDQAVLQLGNLMMRVEFK